MNKIQVFRISKYIVNLIVLGFLWLVISAGFTFYKISIEWSKFEMLANVISRFLPFVILVLMVISVINFCAEKYLEKENRKEFLKILILHILISLALIIYYSYQFYETEIN
jgi:hypothetical protein